MCGRYTLHTNARKLAEAIALAIPDSYAPNYNLGPGREVLTVAKFETGIAARMMHWGLKTPQNFHVNARIETADTSPRFRESWVERRCLLPANGFYEWYADGLTKQPYYLYPEDREIAWLAGLWYPSPEGDETGTCFILTTEAVPTIEKIHHRMPVILPEHAIDSWLCCQLKKPEAVREATQVPFAHHTVSRRVNSVRNNDSQLIKASSPQDEEQLRLF